MTNEAIPHEAALTTTLKGEGRDAPWIVIRSRDAAQLQSQLMELECSPVFTDVGRVAAIMNVNMRLGSNLGAKPLSAAKSDPAVWVDPTVPVANAQQGSAAGAPATPQQSAPPATHPPTGSQQPAPQQQFAPPQGQPQFPGNSGAGMAPNMGGHGGPAPQGAPGMGLPLDQQQPGWDAMQAQQQAPQFAQPAPQQPAPQWTPPGAPSGAPAAQPQQPGSPMAAPVMPGAPKILGRDARFQSGSNARGPWSAFFDPRSQEELASVPIDPQTGRRVQTSDPNDPRLAAGEAEFCLWLK